METRIGVFICNCGGSIKNIDFSAVKEKTAEMPNVAFVSLSSDLCLDEGKKRMLSVIKDKNIDRLVVAACSPDFRKNGFQSVLEEAGMNGQLLSVANIREQCSWAHEGDVTQKAVELVRMAVNRTRLLEPVEKKDFPVNREVLVVGGGICALESALQFSRVGLHTTLLEKNSILGGGSRELEGLDSLKISSMIEAVKGDSNIEILNSAEVLGTSGEIGDFSVSIRQGIEEMSRKFGAIVFASGYETRLVESEGKPAVNVISQEKLAQMLKAPSQKRRPGTIAFILDAADENCRFPILATLNNALAIKERWGSEVYVFCKSVKVDSEGVEGLYRDARERGVVFLKYDNNPRVVAEDGHLRIEGEDVLLGKSLVLICDLLIAEEGISPAEGTKSLSALLNIRTDSQGFYQDENVHLYPVSSERKGLFFIGGCRGDLDLSRALADISSVVIRVHGLLSSGKIAVEVDRVRVDPQKCRVCLTCIRVCPHGATHLVRTGGKEVAEISSLACDACGICAAICPAKAIKFEGYSDEQILSQIEAMGVS